MKRTFFFLVTCAAVIGGLAVVLFLMFTEADVQRALKFAAFVAFGVQVVAFLVARGMAKKNVMAGWGIGVAIRFVALAIFALVAVPRLELPLSSSLMALATFLFLTTLIEPLFLKQ